MPTNNLRASDTSADYESNVVMDVIITPTHQEWLTIKERCYNPNHPSYKDFGAIGATVCAEWLLSYSNFLNDMGAVPHQYATFFIERIDSSKGYYKANCKWTKRAENKHKLHFKIHLPTKSFDLLSPVTEPQTPITMHPPGGPFGHSPLQPKPKSPPSRCTIL